MHSGSASPCPPLVAALALLVCLTAFVPACASTDLTPPLSVQWTFSAGPDPANSTRPLVQEEHVYVTLGGALHCLDARTGGEQWGFSPEEGGVATSALAWEDLVIVGATDGILYGLDAASGRQVWQRLCAAAISPDPILLDDMLMLAAGQMVYSVSPDGGRTGWVTSLSSPAKAGPVTDGSMLYFVCQDGSVQCVDAVHGRFRWRAGIMTGPRVFHPTVGGRRVIVATGNRVYGIARSGGVSWTAEMPVAVGGAPLVVEDTLYVPCVDGQLYTLYARSGAPRREVTYKVENALTATPSVGENAVMVATADGLVYALDRGSGRAEWIYRCRAPDQVAGAAIQFGVYSPLIGADVSLYCFTGTGDLYRFSASAPDSAGPAFTDLRPEPGSALPGGQSITAAFAVTDDGSGLDPSSLQASLDGMPAAVSIDIVTGVGSLRPAVLPDGSHIVKVTAADYRGNSASAEWSFLTDASIEPPEEGAREGTTTRGASGAFSGLTGR